MAGIPKHFDQDLQMPEEYEDAGASVLDQAPDTTTNKKPAGVRIKQTKKGSVQIDLPPEPQSQAVADAEPEIQSMVDVESARPSLPKQLRGVLTVYRTAVNYEMCDDGVTEAITGWAGEINDSPGFQGEILKQWGGGKYECKGIDKKGKEKAIEVKLGGYSKPIPGTPDAAKGYPNGAQPNSQGGFFREGTYPGGIYPGSYPHRPLYDFGIEPQTSTGLVDDDGYFNTEAAATLQGGLTGWVWDYARNNHKWMGPGSPSGPPPTPPGMAAQPFTMYDHSIPKVDPEIKDLKEMVKALVANPRSSDEQRREDERIRREDVEARRQEDIERRREEENRRREDEQRRREDENKRRDEENRRRDAEEVRRREDARLREEERQREDTRRREDARVMIEAQKETARIAAEAQKESAKATADSHRELFKIMANQASAAQNGGAVSMFKEGVEMALGLSGGKEEDAATKISGAIERAAPAVANAARDSIMAIRGYPPTGAPQTQAAAPGQQAAVAPNSEAEQTVKGLQLTGFLVQAWRAGYQPSAQRYLDGCLAYGLLESAGPVAERILMATPEMVVIQFKAGVQALGNPAAFVTNIPYVEAMASDPAGRAWFSKLQQNLRAAAQPVVPPQITVASATAGAPVPNAQATGVDPTRPVIMQSAGPAVPAADPRVAGIDPSRPEIKPS